MKIRTPLPDFTSNRGRIRCAYQFGLMAETTRDWMMAANPLDPSPQILYWRVFSARISGPWCPSLLDATWQWAVARFREGFRI